MDFQYSGSFYVSEQDIAEMVKFCKECDMTPQESLDSISERWDDCDFYMVGLVEDQILKEIEKRLTSTL